jgi:hypothetical protein
LVWVIASVQRPESTSDCLLFLDTLRTWIAPATCTSETATSMLYRADISIIMKRETERSSSPNKALSDPARIDSHVERIDTVCRHR